MLGVITGWEIPQLELENLSPGRRTDVARCRQTLQS